MHNLFSRKIEPFRRGKTTYKLAKGCTSEKFSLKDILEPLKKPEQVEAMYGYIVRNKARNNMFRANTLALNVSNNEQILQIYGFKV